LPKLRATYIILSLAVAVYETSASPRLKSTVVVDKDRLKSSGVVTGAGAGVGFVTGELDGVGVGNGVPDGGAAMDSAS
jgi:hypothetical protein